MLIPIKAIFVSVGASAIRSVAGWLENVCDKKSEGGEEITKYEWAKLGATIARVGIISLAMYFPLDMFGIEAAELGAAGSAIVLDWFRSALKTKKMVIEEEPSESKEESSKK